MNITRYIWRYIAPQGLLSSLLIVAFSIEANADSVASFDDGNRIVASYHWKIEHAKKSVLEILVTQLGTAEGRTILADAAALLGLDPTVAKIVASNVPLPHIDYGATENKGVLASPSGMTICKAGPLGQLKFSRAAWSSTVVRNSSTDGLAYYTAVGTDPHETHSIEGSFYVEFVKKIDNWEAKFGCLPNGTVVWNIHG